VALGPQALGPQALGPQALGPQALGPHALGPQALGPQALGPLRVSQAIRIPPNMSLLSGSRLAASINHTERVRAVHTR